MANGAHGASAEEIGANAESKKFRESKTEAKDRETLMRLFVIARKRYERNRDELIELFDC